MKLTGGWIALGLGAVGLGAALYFIKPIDHGLESPTLRPVTTEQAERYGDEIVSALASCHRESLDALVDTRGIILRAADVARITGPARTGFVSGAEAGNVTQSLCSPGSESKFTLLRVRDVDGQPAPLVRVLDEDGGLNYYEFKLTEDNNKAVRAIDVLLYNSGEPLSQSMGALARGVMSGGTFSQVDLSSISSDIETAVAAGEGSRALRIIDDLPLAVRHTLAIELMRLAAAESVGPDEHTQALIDFSARHPNSGAMDLMSINSSVANGQWDKVLASLNSLAVRLGGDPYLDGLRAQVMSSSGDYAGAIATASTLLESNPSDENSWNALLEALALSGDFAGVVTGIGKMESALHIEISPTELGEIEAFVAFVASPVGKAWAASRAEEE